MGQNCGTFLFRVGVKETIRVVPAAGVLDDNLLRSADILLAGAPVGFAIVDRDLRLLRINQKLAGVNGRTVEEVQGRCLAEFNPALAQTIAPAIQRVFETGEPATDVEVPVQFETHTTDWLASYHPIRSRDNQSVISVVVIITDVSRLKAVEAELRTARAEMAAAVRRLNFHIENSPVIITEWDKGFVLKYWSPQAERVFGWTAAEVVGKTPWEFGFVHEEDVEPVENVNRRMNTGVDARNISFNRNYDKWGKVHQCEWYNSALIDDDGELNSIFAITLDVTDQVHAQDAMRESEERLKLAFDAAYMGAWDWDILTGKLRWWANCEALFGIEPGTFDGRFETLMSLVHPDDRATFTSELERSLASRSPSYRSEFRIVWPDGSVHWILAVGKLFVDATGRPYRMTGVNTEITDQKMREEVLRTNETRLRMAMQAARMGTWEADIRTHRTIWSDEQWTLFGFQRDSCEPSYESWLRVVHPDDRTRVVHTVGDCRRTGSDINIEYRCVGPDGTVHWMQSMGRVVCDESGSPVRVVGVNMDITQRKMSEEALRLSDRLAATGRMAASLAHEINNPLTSVTNLLYLLERGEHDEQSREYLALASAELGRVGHITKTILSLYRESPSAVPVKLNEILDNILDFYAPRLEQADVTVQKHYRAPATIKGFPGELRQLFLNLVMNAIDAMHDNGILSMRVDLARSGGKPVGVRVTVADSGPGIPYQHRKRIFEPFFTTKGEKGTGLGLWICQEIVAKHGGSLRMRTSTLPGRSGTTFSVVFPIASEFHEHPGTRAATQAD
jgi:PAS domain S-box-containing protein